VNSLRTDLADLYRRLKKAKEDIDVLKQEYELYKDHDLIEIVDDPTQPAPVCPSAFESLRFACVAVDDAVKNASMLRAK